MPLWFWSSSSFVQLISNYMWKKSTQGNDQIRVHLKLINRTSGPNQELSDAISKTGVKKTSQTTLEILSIHLYRTDSIFCIDHVLNLWDELPDVLKDRVAVENCV